MLQTGYEGTRLVACVQVMVQTGYGYMLWFRQAMVTGCAACVQVMLQTEQVMVQT